MVREALRRFGVRAWSCDLQPADDGSEFHFQCDVRIVLRNLPGFFTLFVAHPDCTYLTSSGLHWNHKRPERALQTERALEFVREMLGADIPYIALENPAGCIGTRIRKADDSFQPYEFGDDASKRTLLWLKNLPKLEKGVRCNGRMVNGVERWANQTDSGQNKLGPSDDRWKLRSQTYPGFAAALAEQYVQHINRERDL